MRATRASARENCFPREERRANRSENAHFTIISLKKKHMAPLVVSGWAGLYSGGGGGGGGGGIPRFPRKRTLTQS